MDSRKLFGQLLYEETFNTSAGWVVVAAEVRSLGRTLQLAEIAIEPLDTRVLLTGVADILAIRRAIESSAKLGGYTHLVISGHRISGANPDRQISLRRRLV